ncbi:MAG: hypothetical protein K2Y10_06080 [Burkholderiaceae bacterium]|nr:hypothetical protein [Burkholderiaceae bacterium]
MKLKIKAIAILVALLVALGIFGNIMNRIEAHQKEEAAKAAALASLAARKQAQEKRDAQRAEFVANKPQLLAQAKGLIDQGKPDAALELLAKFEQFKDPDIVHAQQLAQTAKRIRALSDQLATKPNVLKAMDIYRELTALQPSNPLWPAMMEEIQPKVAAIQMRQSQVQASANREQAVKRLFSPWDGSVHVVEEAVKARLKDPDSYKHVETRYTDSGAGNIKVFTQYRARNSFNAVVPSTATAEVSPTGELISLSTN